jgi:exonuclease III
MDGVGVGRLDEFDAVHLARTPTLDQLRESGPYRTLVAHGKAVGLPGDGGSVRIVASTLDDAGFVDGFREVNREPEHYTWWSNRGRAWEKNVGWRIDYQVLSPRLRGSVRSAEIFKAHRFSDHAPLTLDYDL